MFDETKFGFEIISVQMGPSPIQPDNCAIVIVTGIKLRSSQNIGGSRVGGGALGTSNPFRSNFRFQFHVDIVVVGKVTKIITL